MSDFPFNGWLRLAVTQFGLTPAQFWALPVADWMALATPPAHSRLSRRHLGALMQDFPDKETNHE